MLAHVSGDAFAQVFWESLVIPLDNLVDIALANVKRAGSEPNVTSRKHVVVEGNEACELRFDATVQGNLLSYRNLYYSGKSGSIQIMTWTKRDDLGKYEKDLLELVAGFHVIE